MQELSTARASAADAEHEAEEAQKSTQARRRCEAPRGAALRGLRQELQEFLSSPEVLAIDSIQQEVAGQGRPVGGSVMGRDGEQVERMSFAEAYQVRACSAPCSARLLCALCGSPARGIFAGAGCLQALGSRAARAVRGEKEKREEGNRLFKGAEM